MIQTKVKCFKRNYFVIDLLSPEPLSVSHGLEIWLAQRLQYFNPIALRKAKIVYILAFLCAIGLILQNN